MPIEPRHIYIASEQAPPAVGNDRPARPGQRVAPGVMTLLAAPMETASGYELDIIAAAVAGGAGEGTSPALRLARC